MKLGIMMVMRANEYQKIIAKVLQQHHLLSLAEIHAQVPEAHFTSIYRNVEHMCDEGLLKKVVISKNNVRYELASHGHGHFVCNDCDTVAEVDVPVSMNRHYAQISEMLLRGVCVDCSSAQKV